MGETKRGKMLVARAFAPLTGVAAGIFLPLENVSVLGRVGVAIGVTVLVLIPVLLAEWETR